MAALRARAEEACLARCTWIGTGGGPTAPGPVTQVAEWHPYPREPKSSDPLFFVCRGKSCRKRKKAHAAVLEALSRVAAVRQVTCRSVCKGPVVGYRHKTVTTWFRRVDSKKIRKGLLALARRGKMAGALKKRRCDV
jgi:(2Fe-2S) ferredoxin